MVCGGEALPRPVWSRHSRGTRSRRGKLPRFWSRLPAFPFARDVAARLAIRGTHRSGRISRDSIRPNLRTDEIQMNFVAILLRLAGAGLILLAILHVPMSKRLMWREEGARMSLVN